MNNGSQDMPSEPMPPMDIQPQTGDDMGGGFMPQGDMQQPPMGNEMPNQFDTNFDAGVDADEEQDPKKYIQQLTGKLSQTLQKYTDDNGQADVDLNKYVAGMIVKQAMKGLSEQDAEEIIDKVKSDEDFSMDDGNGDQQQGEEMGGDIGQPEYMQQGNDMQQPPMNENFSKWNRKRNIREIVNGVLDKDEDDEPRQKPRNNGGYKTSVYTSPNFRN